jgi:hypothetical protein
MTTLCPVCGWRGHCTTVMEAVVCNLNAENWRKYMLRNKGPIARGDLLTPTLVRSERGGDPNHPDGPGRGNAREELVPVTVEEAKERLAGLKPTPPRSPE